MTESDMEISEHEVSIIEVVDLRDKQSEVGSSRRSSRQASTRAHEKMAITNKVMSSRYQFDKDGSIMLDDRVATKKRAKSVSRVRKSSPRPVDGPKIARVTRKSSLRSAKDVSPPLQNLPQVVKVKERNTVEHKKKQPQERSQSTSRIDREPDPDSRPQVVEIKERITVEHKKKQTQERSQSTSRIDRKPDAEPNPKSKVATANNNSSLINRRLSFMEGRIDHLERKLLELQNVIANKDYIEVGHDFDLARVPIDAPNFRFIAVNQLQQYQNEAASWDQNVQPVFSNPEQPFDDLKFLPEELHMNEEQFTGMNSWLSTNMRKGHNISKYIDPSEISILQQQKTDPPETDHLNAYYQRSGNDNDSIYSRESGKRRRRFSS